MKKLPILIALTLFAALVLITISDVFAKKSVVPENEARVGAANNVERKYIVEKRERADKQHAYYELVVDGKLFRSWYRTQDHKARVTYYDRKGKKIADVEKKLFDEWITDGKNHLDVTEFMNCVAVYNYSIHREESTDLVKEKYGITEEEIWNYGVTIFNLYGEKVFKVNGVDAMFNKANEELSVFVFKKSPVFDEEGRKPGFVYVFNNNAELLFKRECYFNGVFVSPKGNWLVFETEDSEGLYLVLAADSKTGKIFKLDVMPPIYGVNDNCDLLSEDGKVLYSGSQKKPYVESDKNKKTD